MYDIIGLMYTSNRKGGTKMFSVGVKECAEINRIIYEMSLVDNEEALRNTFLCRLKNLIPFHSASFYLAKDNLFSAANPVYYNCDEKFAELYNNELFRKDIILKRLCSSNLYVYNSTDVLDVYQHCDDIFMNFMIPQELHYTAGMNFVFNHNFLGFIVLFRGLNDRDFSKKDLFILYQFQKCLSHNLYNLTDSILGPSTINDMRKKN